MRKKREIAIGTLTDPTTGTELQSIKIDEYWSTRIRLLVNSKQSPAFLKWFGQVISEEKKQIVRFYCEPQAIPYSASIPKTDNFYYVKRFNARASKRFNWTIKLELIPAEDNFEIMKAYGKRNKRKVLETV